MFNLKILRQFFEKKASRVDKRLRLVISVLILGLLMLISTFFNFDKAFFFLPVFVVVTYFLSYFSLLEGIKKIGWFGLFLMPELITLFFYLFYFLFSLKYNFFINIIGAGIGSLLLSLQLFWTIRLNKYLEKDVLIYSLFMALLMSEIGLLISFVPLRIPVYALFLTATYYSLTGIICHYIDQKLFKGTIREYVSVWVFVMIITLLSL